MSFNRSRKTQSLDEVKGIISALLVARKHSSGVPVTQLDQDYREEEGIRIPFRDFNFPTLIDFLESLRETLIVSERYGGHVVYPIVNEKIKHVSALVAGQRQPGRKSMRGRRPMGRSRSCYSTPMYYPPRRLHSRLLSDVVKLVQMNPEGIEMHRVLQFVRDKMMDNNYELQFLLNQIREIPHEIKIDGNILYAAKRWPHDRFVVENRVNSGYERREGIESFDKQQASNFRVAPSAQNSSGSGNHISHSNIRMAGSSASEDECGFELVSPAAEAFVTEKMKEMEKISEYHSSKIDSNSLKNEKKEEEEDKIESNAKDETKKDTNSDYSENIGALIGERTRFRLEKLVQNRPEGIWCAELPSLYYKEYGIKLNYEDLGFYSVSDYASYLPDIFHCVQPQELGDIKLFDAKATKPSIKQRERPKKTLTLADLHNIYGDDMNDKEALPLVVSPEISCRLFPDGAMRIGETVAQISVGNITKGVNEFISVIVVEIFTPSFFWIHLFERTSKFKKFMADLHTFYENQGNKYMIPLVILEKGLNCACKYADVWHRGIIKSVAPDHTVTVMFYDYGTIKSYPPQEIHFLHRLWSSLPAQAIPCGLYNVRPVGTSRWPQSASYEFADQVRDIPLIATIAKKDDDNNSMLIGLTNTHGTDDFHINDWMVETGLAVYGKMVCIRPPNYPFRRFLECEYSNNKNKLNDASIKLSSKEIVDYSNAENVDPGATKSSNRELSLYERLLKLHRSRNSPKDIPKKSDNVPVLGSEENRGETRKFNQWKSQIEKDEPSFEFAKRNSSPLAKRCHREGVDDRFKLGAKLLAFYGAHAKNRCASGGSNISSSKNSSCKLGDSPRLQKVNLNKQKMPENNIKRERDVEIRLTEVSDIPLHLQSTRFRTNDENDKEFRSFRSQCGGNGRMEPIDWKDIRECVKKKDDESKSVKTSAKIAKSTKDILELLKKNQKPSVNLTESLMNVTLSKNESIEALEDPEKLEEPLMKSTKVSETIQSPLPISTSPKLPPGKKALWNLVKNRELQNRNKSMDSTHEYDNFHSKREETSVDWATLRTIVKSPPKIGKKWQETPKTTTKSVKIPEGEIVQANKQFMNMINHCLVPQTDHPESLCIPEGNIQFKNFISPAVRVAMNKVKNPNNNKMRVHIPKEILEIMMSDENGNDSNTEINRSTSNVPQQTNKSDENLNEIPNHDAPKRVIKSTRLQNILKRYKDANSILRSGELSSDEMPASSSSSESPKKLSTLLNSTGSTNEGDYECKDLSSDSMNETAEKISNDSELKSAIRKIDGSNETMKGEDIKSEVKFSTELSSPSIESSNAWIENARLKPNKEQLTKISKLLTSRLDSTIDSELDSDDLSLSSKSQRCSAEKKENSAKTMGILKSKDAGMNNSVEDKIDNSQTTLTTTKNACEGFDSSTDNFEVAKTIEDPSKSSKDDNNFCPLDSKTTNDNEIADKSFSNLSHDEEQFVDFEETFEEIEKNVAPKANNELVLKDFNNDCLTIEINENKWATAPIFDDTAMNSDSDTWDYAPGLKIEENSENEMEELECDENVNTQNRKLLAIEESPSLENSDEKSRTEPLVEMSTKNNLSSDESSLSISDNIEENCRSGSSRPETDSDTQNFERRCASNDNYDDNHDNYPISIGRSKTSLVTIENWNSRKSLPRVGSQISRGNDNERCNLTDEQCFENAPETVSSSKYRSDNTSAEKNCFSILSEVKKSKISAKTNAFSIFDSSSSSDDNKSRGSSYASSLISAFKKYT